VRIVQEQRENCFEKARPADAEAGFVGAGQAWFSFCSTSNCSIVYFEDQAREQFTIDDLRIRVGVKVNDDPIPLCYCFGFDEKDIRDEIEQTGNTSIPEKVARLIREDLCSCETLNPAGVCCLGEVNQATKRLKREFAATLKGQNSSG
jgi:hypothetical protein